MKQVLKLTLWLLLLPMAMQAQDRTSIDKIEAIAQNLYLKENYKKCVERRGQYLMGNTNSVVWRLYFHFQGEKYRCTGRNFFNWFPAVL